MHFLDGRLDPWVGFQPGLALTRAVDGPARVSPVASVAVGSNFLVSSLFHFFVEGRQMLGRHLTDEVATVSLNEARLSFGLGFSPPGLLKTR